MKAKPQAKRSVQSMRLGLWGLLPLGVVLLVTAGKVQEISLPPPTDELQQMLDRVDVATDIIARRMAASTVPLEWEAMQQPEERSELSDSAPSADTEDVIFVDAGNSIQERVEQLHFQGIAWNEINPVAFVSRKTLEVNGEIYGLRVVHIGQDNVVFEDERGQNQELRLSSYSEVLQIGSD